MASLSTSYYTVDGEIIGETTGGVRLDYQVDALGSVTGHIDQTGVSINKARYKPYGGLLSGTQYTVGWCGTLGYRTKSTLKSADVYVRARSYGTKTGQWATRDPLWPTMQPTSYAKDSPVTVVDPSGLKPVPDVISACIYLFCSGELAWDRFTDLKGILKEPPKDIAGLVKDACKRYKDRPKKDPVEECVEKVLSQKDGKYKLVYFACKSLPAQSGYECMCRYKDREQCLSCCDSMKGYTGSCKAACMNRDENILLGHCGGRRHRGEEPRV